MWIELDGIDGAREAREHRGLIARPGADFENFLGTRELGDLAHQSDHVRLRNSLRVADRQRAVIVGVLVKFGGKESMAGDGAHRGEHARIFYPAAFELLEHHPRARVFQVCRHR